LTTETTMRTKAPAPGTYHLDPAHSDLTIVARHLMVSKVRGTFRDMSGTIEVSEDPAESTAEIVAKAESITTGEKERDNHLRSPDFLNAEKYPEVTFKSTEVTANGDKWKLSGDLTIRDITKPVTFEMAYQGSATDPYGNTKAAFTASGEINREEWGLTWNVALESGGVLVSKNLRFDFDVQATLQG
jgi:polyisoprenoid-binding protein YceI